MGEVWHIKNVVMESKALIDLGRKILEYVRILSADVSARKYGSRVYVCVFRFWLLIMFFYVF